MTVILAARLTAAIIGIVFVPVYVRIIGEESYGLVAFYSTLAGSLALLDVGLSAAVTREVAVMKAKNGTEKEIRDLVYTVEVINWAVALIAGLLIILFSGPIASEWVKAKELPVATIQHCIMLMGAMFAFQFPVSVYDGVLIGSQRQVPDALINLIVAGIKTIGVIAFLKIVSSTVEAYFIWQASFTLLLTLTLRYYAMKGLFLQKIKAQFSKKQLQVVWKFAAGLTGISVITFFLSQIDKIVVSKKLTLDFVGYYSLAFLVAGGITQVLSPMQPVIYPKFTTLVAQEKKEELAALYHKSCKWVAIIAFPIGMVLVLFSKQLLLLWTKNETLTLHTAPILEVAAAGTVLNCLMWMSYYYLLAKGITKYTIRQNIIACIILVPLLFWWTDRYGALGAAFVWLTVNAGYVLFSLPVFHAFYMKGELWSWIKNDTIVPLLVSAIIGGAAKWIQYKFFPDISIIPFAVILIICGIIYVLVMKETRMLLIKMYKSKTVK